MFSLKHPYPTEDEKRQIAAQTNLSLLQVNNWWVADTFLSCLITQDCLMFSSISDSTFCVSGGGVTSAIGRHGI